MSAPLKCPHGKFAGLCSVCKQQIGAKQLGANLRNWDKTWHALRLETHARFTRFLRAIHDSGWSSGLYYTVYDKPRVRARSASYDEDPESISGSLYLALLKMTDVTIDGHRIQGYNAESEWTEIKERLCERYAPGDLPDLLATGRLQIHGGNSSWSNQQRAPQLVLSKHVWDVLGPLAFGPEGTPAEVTDDVAQRRIEEAQARARRLGVGGMSISVASKIYQCFAAKRWAVVNTRANADVASKAGDELPIVRTAADYLAFSARCRELAAQRGLADLEMLDISFSNLYEAGGGRKLGNQ